MSEVSTFRRYLLRAMYAFMFVGLAIFKWPGILNPPPGISNTGTVVGSVLGALSLLAVLGIRYPVKMLPLLFFELLWKVMWVLGCGLPLWFTQQSGQPRNTDQLSHGRCVGSTRHSVGRRIQPVCEGARKSVG